jgi:L-ascorbate metabolism protein UlaG (beta-lactamase superfamily)
MSEQPTSRSSRPRRRRWPLVVLGAVAIGTVAAVQSTDWLRSFGAQPTGDRLTRMQRSPRYRDGAFENAVPTRKSLPGSFRRTMKLQFTGDQQRVPPSAIPIVAVSRETYATPPASGLRATWLGHSTTLLEVDGVRVLTDPVWGERASPSTWVGPRRFHPPPLPLNALPPIDAVIISHDHYDHLDMPTIRALAADSSQQRLRFVVPLGIGAHLERWGVAPERITELDWGDTTRVGDASRGATLTAAPSRHFSGRRLRDAVGRGNPTLWATWVIAGDRHRVFFSGDTGFFEDFAKIGDQLGPFDLTLIKIGAYGETWPEIHVNPEEAVRAHTLLRGRVLLPIHWGTFNLAFHAWTEPAERVVRAAREAGAVVTLPRPGQPLEPSALPPHQAWWQEVR